MENDIPVWWPLLALTPFICFALGWFAARVDMKTVLKQAKILPAASIVPSKHWWTETAARRRGSWPKRPTPSRSLTN